MSEISKASNKDLVLELVTRGHKPAPESFFRKLSFTGNILLSQAEYDRLREDLSKELAYKTKQYRHFQENPDKIRSPKHWKALERDREFVLNVLAFLKLAEDLIQSYTEQAATYQQHYLQASQVNDDMLKMAMKAVGKNIELKNQTV